MTKANRDFPSCLKSDMRPWQPLPNRDKTGTEMPEFKT